MPEKDYLRTIRAAILDKKFQEQLLNPNTRESVLRGGYMGIPFGYTEDEIRFLVGLKAENFADFVNQSAAQWNSDLKI